MVQEEAAGLSPQEERRTAAQKRLAAPRHAGEHVRRAAAREEIDIRAKTEFNTFLLLICTEYIVFVSSTTQ